MRDGISGFALGFMVMLFFAATTTSKYYVGWERIVDRGLAEYCATDVRFAFKGECGE